MRCRAIRAVSAVLASVRPAAYCWLKSWRDPSLCARRWRVLSVVDGACRRVRLDTLDSNLVPSQLEIAGKRVEQSRLKTRRGLA